jgi:hypothetical protein
VVDVTTASEPFVVVDVPMSVVIGLFCGTSTDEQPAPNITNDTKKTIIFFIKKYR